MKFLVAGLGSIGRRHLRNLQALGEKDILLFRTHQATLPDGELNGYPVETDLGRALQFKPEAVIIANPTALHLSVAVPAAEAGCHLLIDKPVSNTLEGLDELKTALTRGGGKVLVGFQFRFHPGLQRIKELLGEQAIGRPLSVRAHWGEHLPGWHPWEDFRQSYAARPELGGGAVLTLCHPLDYLHWLIGEAETLWAFTSRHGLGLEVEDTAEIGLRFKDGTLGSVHLDYVQRPTRHTLEIVGTEGTITWDNASGTVRLSQPARNGAGEGSQAFPLPAGFERNSMFLAEMSHFRQVARGECEPICPLDDGLYALKLALAALRSEREHASCEIG
jgi:predicted dehydrogenase